MRKSAEKPARAAAKAAARSPKKTAALPKKATRRTPAAFADLLGQFDIITDRLTGSLEAQRSGLDRRQKEIERAAGEQRTMLLAVAKENAELRDHADDVERLAETMIAAAKAACAATLQRDFSAATLDPLGDTTHAADLALAEFRKTRAAIYAPPPTVATVSAAAPAAGAEAPTQIEAPAALPSAEPLEDDIARELAEIGRQSEVITDNPPANDRVPPTRLWQPPERRAEPAIQPDTARNSVTAIAKRKGIFARLNGWINAELGDLRTIGQHLRGESEFAWEGKNGTLLETRDGYLASIVFHIEQNVWEAELWVRVSESTADGKGKISVERVGGRSLRTLEAAQKSVEQAIFRHRAAVARAERFSAGLNILPDMADARP
ncbi:hypothetical protein IZ6_07440 [Terrihabitans soli]|uniref:Uncharacterized protein n=1 Tax=Terrihabitans soli TaxID=708113 RepID=A0A6S6QM58_9HYPH|nr:hypothetical protein [Terrihabitans soli]BCJ90009.1 hypothetical protein IZ6_07440 [Terrihabitans soli]